MTSPYGDKALCARLPSQELEDTFHYPGPGSTRDKPSALSQMHWDLAKEFCLNCPVFLRCRETTIGEEYGVVGGRDQYERYKLRRQIASRYNAMGEEEQAAEAARINAMHAPNRGMGVEALARRTGYTQQAVQRMLELHKANTFPTEERRHGVLSDEERERLARMVAKGESVRIMAAMLGRNIKFLKSELAKMAPATRTVKPSWPSAPPPSDAWAWHNGVVRNATYGGQTEDGQWLYMTLRGDDHAPTRRWFTRDHVQLRRHVSVQILEWHGRSEREGRSPVSLVS